MMYQKQKMGKLYVIEGMIGFTQLQEYQLTQEEEGSPFFVLQAEKDENVSFWVVEPFIFYPEYEFDLSESVKESLHINEQQDVSVLNIMTVRDNNQITVNLKAPLIVNVKTGQAKQIILKDDTYDLRQPLIPQQNKPVKK